MTIETVLAILLVTSIGGALMFVAAVSYNLGYRDGVHSGETTERREWVEGRRQRPALTARPARRRPYDQDVDERARLALVDVLTFTGERDQ